MVLHVSRDDGIPLYVQLKRQIRKLVRTGMWEPGHRLPPERVLASQLKVSRYTVSMAYKELEKEGLLISRQGQGTFVAEAAALERAEDRRERLVALIGQALDDALELGFGLEHFLAEAERQVKQREELLHQIRVLFIECNKEQLDYISKELELGSGVSIVPMFIQKLRHDPRGVMEQVGAVDFTVTTFFHLAEVKELLVSDEVLGIALDPQIDTIVRIARLGKDHRVGLVCLSHAFADRVQKSIANAGIELREILTTTSRDEAKVEELVKRVDAVIASPGRVREVERLVRPGTEVIEFIYKPDAGSINMLKAVLLERRQRGMSSRGEG